MDTGKGFESKETTVPTVRYSSVQKQTNHKVSFRGSQKNYNCSAIERLTGVNTTFTLTFVSFSFERA